MNLDDSEGFRITKQSRRPAAPGTWVEGRIGGHEFEALVFPAHADNPDWELGSSRISKLCLRRVRGRKVVLNFDRGWDLRPVDARAEAAAAELCAGLAELLFGPDPDGPANAVATVNG